MRLILRSLLSVLIGLCLGVPVPAQDPNPQSSFATTESLAGPSLELNFNDQTTAFLDQISGQSFVGTETITGTANYASLPSSYIAPMSTNALTFSANAPFPAGASSIQSISVYFDPPYGPPSAGQTLTFVVTNGQPGQITATFNVAASNSTGLQTFVNGTDFTSPAIVAGGSLGIYIPTGRGIAYGATVGSYFINNCGGGTPTVGEYPSCGEDNHTQALSAVINLSQTYTSGTVTPRQPGFDSTLTNNTSAEFPWNGWSAAPNNTLGAVEWSTPWTMMVQVDRLNWTRTGTLVLASKGDPAAGNWWQLYLNMTANTLSGANGQVSQLCFSRTNPDGGASYASGVCTTPTMDAMPNGFNYNIVVEDNGSGASGTTLGGDTNPNALSLYINGLGPNCAAYANSCIPQQTTAGGGTGYGYVNVSVSGGTGYANSTAFTSTGGGANCVVQGFMTASGGVPNGTTYNANSLNSGCTSAPTIVLTSPTGTGAVLTATTTSESMNSTSYPLMVPGQVYSGAYYGVAGITSTQNPTYVDEFAIFPGNLNMTQIQDLFYWTKFYQLLLGTPPSNRTAFIFDDDGPDDEDNFVALQVAIAEHKLGYIQLEGAVAETYEGSNGAAIFRQMLDQAGLSDVPVGVAGSSATASTTAYNASTPTAYASYPSAASVYQKVMTANPTTPVDILLGGPWDGAASFLQSSGGQTLWNQDASNGGAVYILSAFASCPPAAYPATTPCGGSYGIMEQGDYASAQYVLNNHGSMPLFHWGGTPQSSGPGVFYSRTGKDPMYLVDTSYGSDVRAAYDSLPMTQLASNDFYGGVQIWFSGGTGYANQTYFTSTGGGAGCTVQGIMTASGGVPNGIETLWGVGAAGTTQGIGYGCVNPSNMPSIVLTSPTGTGVTFTVYPTNVCGTYTITSSTASTLSSTPCSDEYFIPFSQLAVSENAPVLTWFLNSLIDPPPTGRPLYAP
jgi:hypothetical protein